MIRRALLAAAFLATGCAPDPFVEVGGFGDNPGALRMFEHVPALDVDGDVDGERSLLVFLHGCQQSHDAARTAGLVTLADQRGFHVLAPEQGRVNNGQACFTWFEAADTARDEGEAASIRQMVAHAVAAHAIPEDRVFVAGLSAGAAMTASLLASYPDVFAAGAVIAGGPAGCAASLLDAAGCMGGTTTHDADAWADLARQRTRDGDERTAWPRVLVMHGREDAVVSPANADALVAQWTTLHGVDDEPTATATLPTSIEGDATRETFGAGEVERVLIDGLEHALPIDPSAGCGEVALFQRGIDLCAVELVATFFGL